MEKVNTRSNIKSVNGIDVLYSRIPVGLVEGFEGIIFYFQTTESFDTEAHEGAVKPIIDILIEKLRSRNLLGIDKARICSLAQT